MITGQRVSVTYKGFRRKLGRADRNGVRTYFGSEESNITITGQVVAYTSAVGVADGYVETRNHVVVQTDNGSIMFFDPRLVRVVAQPAQIQEKAA